MKNKFKEINNNEVNEVVSLTKKILKLKKLLVSKKSKAKISVDGGINGEVAKKLEDKYKTAVIPTDCSNLNSDDLNKGLITVKDNATKEEVKIDEKELIDYLVSNI